MAPMWENWWSESLQIKTTFKIEIIFLSGKFVICVSMVLDYLRNKNLSEKKFISRFLNLFRFFKDKCSFWTRKVSKTWLFNANYLFYSFKNTLLKTMLKKIEYSWILQWILFNLWFFEINTQFTMKLSHNFSTTSFQFWFISLCIIFLNDS